MPFLEALLLLRAEPQALWDAATLARRLYVGEAQAAPLLSALATAGFAQAIGDPPRLQYAPATPELSATLDLLARHYATDLVGVTDLIHSRVDKRAQQFADAFRWRKDS